MKSTETSASAQVLKKTQPEEFDLVILAPNGKALSRARELAELYLKAPEVTRRNPSATTPHSYAVRAVIGCGLSRKASARPAPAR
jgi:hypothetical protein